MKTIKQFSEFSKPVQEEIESGPIFDEKDKYKVGDPVEFNDYDAHITGKIVEPSEWSLEMFKKGKVKFYAIEIPEGVYHWPEEVIKPAK